jgi:hypothetical protein
VGILIDLAVLGVAHEAIIIDDEDDRSNKDCSDNKDGDK